MNYISHPLVTIAIPTWNRVHYLRMAVKSALNQDYPAIEIIVSDNCSADNTREYLSSLEDERLLVLRQPENCGMIGNWNACLKQATGQFFMLLSDDDLLEPTAVRMLVDAILAAEHPESVAFAYCRCWIIDKNDRPLSLDHPAPRYESASDLVMGFFSKEREIRPCATLLRTADVREVGGYSQDSVELAVDAIVWSRILQRRPVAASIPEPLAKYRVHASNLSSVQSIGVWQNDLRELSSVWIDFFKFESDSFRRKLLFATRAHQAWMISVTINQAARSYADRLRLLKTYFRCRASFVGLPGAINLVLGLSKLLVPERVKKPIRGFLIWKQQLNDPNAPGFEKTG